MATTEYLNNASDQQTSTSSPNDHIEYSNNQQSASSPNDHIEYANHTNDSQPTSTSSPSDQTMCGCTTRSKNEVIGMILTLVERNNLSWKVCCDILNVINKIYDHDVIDSSKYKLMKLLVEKQPKKEFYCPSCLAYSGIILFQPLNFTFTFRTIVLWNEKYGNWSQNQKKLFSFLHVFRLFELSGDSVEMN